MIKIEDVSLVLSCGACPEAYDAYYKDEYLGYLRLRHGVFSVYYGEGLDEVIFLAHPQGDGIFDSDEREAYLNKAKQLLILRYNQDVKK